MLNLPKLSKPVLKQINSCPTVAVTVDQQWAEKQIVVESAEYYSVNRRVSKLFKSAGESDFKVF